MTPNPCEHGGACTDAVNGYTCSCIAGTREPTARRTWTTVTRTHASMAAHARTQSTVHVLVRGFLVHGNRLRDGRDDQDLELHASMAARARTRSTGTRARAWPVHGNRLVRRTWTTRRPEPVRARGGACTRTQSTTRARAYAGTRGPTATDVDDCDSELHASMAAHATDAVSGGTLQLRGRYTGTNCETDVDDQYPEPMRAWRARARTQSTRVHARAKAGYTGTNCETVLCDLNSRIARRQLCSVSRVGQVPPATITVAANTAAWRTITAPSARLARSRSEQRSLRCPHRRRLPCYRNQKAEHGVCKTCPLPGQVATDDYVSCVYCSVNHEKCSLCALKGQGWEWRQRDLRCPH